MLTGCHTAAL